MVGLQVIGRRKPLPANPVTGAWLWLPAVDLEENTVNWTDHTKTCIQVGDALLYKASGSELKRIVVKAIAYDGRSFTFTGQPLYPMAEIPDEKLGEVFNLGTLERLENELLIDPSAEVAVSHGEVLSRFLLLSEAEYLKIYRCPRVAEMVDSRHKVRVEPNTYLVSHSWLASEQRVELENGHALRNIGISAAPSGEVRLYEAIALNRS
jgi:hypothetical protein